MIFGQGSRAPTLWSPPVALRRFTTRVRFLIINRSAVAETRANCLTTRLDGIGHPSMSCCARRNAPAASTPAQHLLHDLRSVG